MGNMLRGGRRWLRSRCLPPIGRSLMVYGAIHVAIPVDPVDLVDG